MKCHLSITVIGCLLSGMNYYQLDCPQKAQRIRLKKHPTAWVGSVGFHKPCQKWQSCNPKGGNSNLTPRGNLQDRAARGARREVAPRTSTRTATCQWQTLHQFLRSMHSCGHHGADCWRSCARVETFHQPAVWLH